MSRENVEVVRRLFDAWNQGDPELLVSHLASDAEADWSEAIGPAGGRVYRGRTEVKAFYEGFLDAWGEAHWEPLEILGLDEERVLSVNRMSARGRHSGIDATASAAVIWTVRDGRIARAKLFQSEQEALEAAGPSG